jgi:hypothetical protein
MTDNYSIYSDIEIYISHIIESNITYKPSNFDVIDPEKTTKDILNYLNEIGILKHPDSIKNENVNVS